MSIALSYTSIYARGHLLLTYCVILGDVGILCEIPVVESRRIRSLSPARPPSRRGWSSLSSLSSCPGLYPRRRRRTLSRGRATGRAYTPCPRGGSAPRRPPDASRRSRPTPRRRWCHRGFVRGRHGRTRLVVRFSRPGQTDGVTQSHAPVIILL